MINATINVNGQIQSCKNLEELILHPSSPKYAAIKIPVYDRSYLYGDSLYEVARTYGGKFLFLEEHLERLELSCQLCHLKLDQTLEELKALWLKTYEVWLQDYAHLDSQEAYARIVVSRGIGKIGFAQSNVKTPTQITLIVQPVDAPTPELYEKGYALKIVDRVRNHPRALDPAMKSGNYLNSVLAYLEAKPTFDDALMLNADGHMTEGTTFNIFYVKNKIIVTPPLDIGILDGITRRHVLKVARQNGYDVRGIRFTKEHFLNADEIFLTSSVREVFPITRVDQKRFKVGPVTRHLGALYQTEMNTYIKGHAKKI
jgi:branched-chain amino acid aminotransferase